MRYITTEWLKEKGACHSSIRNFNKVFKTKKVRITLKNINLFTKNGYAWSSNLWHLSNFLGIREEYERTRLHLSEREWFSKQNSLSTKAFWQCYKETYLKRRKSK